jgi:2'-5' RNA ligase
LKSGALRQRRGDRTPPGAVHGKPLDLQGPWIADHFALYSSRGGRSGSIYTEEAAYGLTF